MLLAHNYEVDSNNPCYNRCIFVIFLGFEMGWMKETRGMKL